MESNTLCCFRNLKTVEIIRCPSLGYVFRSLASAPRLTRLEKICLFDLEKISGFVAENGFVEAPALKILRVRGCPRFTNFIIQKEANNNSVSLQELAFSIPESSHNRDHELYNMMSASPSFEYECMRNFEQLFQLQGGYLISNVEDLTFSNMIWLQHIWKGRLTIHSCHSLTYIFPMTLIPDLPQLNYLEIANCDKLEHIVIADDDILQPASSSSQGRRQIGLSQFGGIKIQELSSLVSFIPVGYHLIFSNLESLLVHNCSKMIPSFTVDYSAASAVHAKRGQPPPLNNKSIDWDWRRPFVLPTYVEEAEEISSLS